MKLDIEKIGEAELLAYVDGQLEADDIAIIERYLEANPDKAEEVAEWRRQSEAIHALYDHAAREDVPERLNPHRLANAPRPANSNLRRLAAAAIVLLAVGSGAAGWYGRGLVEPEPGAPAALISAAVRAHELFTPQTAHPVEVGADEAGHLTAWLSTSLDRRLVVPKSLPTGLKLVGGRLLSAALTPAAQIMYEADGRRVTLYLTPKTADNPRVNTFQTVGDITAYYWASDSVTCTIVGNLTRAELEEIAIEVFKTLSQDNPNYRGV